MSSLNMFFRNEIAEKLPSFAIDCDWQKSALFSDWTMWGGRRWDRIGASEGRGSGWAAGEGARSESGPRTRKQIFTSIHIYILLTTEPKGLTLLAFNERIMFGIQSMFLIQFHFMFFFSFFFLILSICISFCFFVVVSFRFSFGFNLVQRSPLLGETQNVFFFNLEIGCHEDNCYTQSLCHLVWVFLVLIGGFLKEWK